MVYHIDSCLKLVQKEKKEEWIGGRKEGRMDTGLENDIYKGPQHHTSKLNLFLLQPGVRLSSSPCQRAPISAALKG